MLALARDTHSDRQPIDVAALTFGAQARFKQRLHDGRSMTVEVSEAMPRPIASMSAVAQALDVLIENAIRHGAGQVRITARPTGHHGTMIAVSDEGQGLIEGDVLRERRADSARGHGIGLALARRLVEAEGGQLRLACAGPNPRFEIILPA